MANEVNISHAKTVISPRHLNYIVSTSENTHHKINVVVRKQVKQENSTLPVAARGSKTLHA